MLCTNTRVLRLFLKNVKGLLEDEVGVYATATQISQSLLQKMKLESPDLYIYSPVENHKRSPIRTKYGRPSKIINPPPHTDPSQDQAKK